MILLYAFLYFVVGTICAYFIARSKDKWDTEEDYKVAVVLSYFFWPLLITIILFGLLVGLLVVPIVIVMKLANRGE